MPDLSAYASAFRGAHRYTGWLSPVEEPIVFSRAVNMASITYPLKSITFDDPYSGAGAYTDVEEGAEIRVFSGNTSTEKGRLRVAYGGSTSTVIQVNEVSKNRINLADNDRFEVLRSWRVRDKMIAANATFDKDSRRAYVDENELVPPRVVDGGHTALFLTSGSAVVDFIDGSESADPDGGSLSHAWTVSGGSLSNAAIATPDWTISAAGTYWARHTVTDGGNSKAWVKRSVAVVHDENSLPIPCSVDSLGGTLTDGWSTTFRVHAHSGIDKLPNGAMLLYHENEVYGTTKASYGNRVPSRSRVKGVFYLVKHSIRMDWQTGELVFEALSPRARLFKLPGFSQVLTAVGDPSTWQEWKTPLSTNDVLLYLLRWHTTYTELYDVLLPDENYPYPEFFVEQSTPGGQLIEIADAVDGVVAADRTGALIIRQDLNQLGSTARSTATVAYDFTESDILDIEIEESHEYPVAELIGRGFTTGGEPLQSKSGNAPAEASDFTSADRLIVDAQEGTDRDLNERTGRRWQRANQLKNGLPVPSVKLTLRGGYDVFDPAYGEWVTITLSRTIKGRVVSYSGARFWIQSVNVRHEVTVDDAGNEIRYKRVELYLVGETDGPAGVTFVEPQQGTNDITIPDYSVEFPGVTYTLPTGRGLRRGTRRIAKLMSDGTIARSFDFETPASSGGPTYESVDIAALGLTGGVIMGVVDPRNPTNIAVLTGSKVGSANDIFGTVAASGVHTLPVAGGGGWQGDIQTERGTDRMFVATIHDGAVTGTNGVYAIHSTDLITWTDTQITTTEFTNGGYPHTAPVWVSPRTGRVYTSIPVVDQPNASRASQGRYATISNLADWSNTTSLFATGTALSDQLYSPFADPSETTFWCNYNTAVIGGTQNLYRFRNGVGANRSPVYGGNNYSMQSNVTRRAMDTYAGDKRIVLFVGAYIAPGGAVSYGVWKSNDEGDTWQLLITPSTSVKARGCAIAGDNPNTFFLFGADGYLAVSYDGGVTWDDRTGDHVTSATVVNIFG